MSAIIKKLSVGILLSIILNTNTANAGGDYHHIQITEIKTISDKEHHISFKVNNTQNWQYDEFNACESVDWIVDYQEWEIFHNIILTLKNIITFNHSKKQLNKIIEILKNNNNKNYVILTMGSSGYFQTNPNNNCQIFSKNLIILEREIDGRKVLEPIRHQSEIVNRK